jgi:hypothetical protein
MMGVITQPDREDPDMLDAICEGGFAPPDLTVFCRLDGLGLVVTGQRLGPGRAVVACRVAGETARERWCGRCGGRGEVSDSVTRQLAHEPFGWRPTTLVVTLRRYVCADCSHVWRQDMTAAADPRAKLLRRALTKALIGLVVGHLSVAQIARALGVSWNTANDAVLGEGRRVLISDPGRFEGVRVLGVDEHVWRHTRTGDKYVTVIIDITPVAEGTGPARSLDMVAGRSEQAFAAWLAGRPKAWRDGIEVVAMDGFTGFKTARADELPAAVTVMDPFRSTWSASLATPSKSPAAGPRRTCMATGAARTTRCSRPGGPCSPVPTCSPTASSAVSTTSSLATSTSRSK